eukprot:COSAG01_NODE_2340_length_7871_cov_32.734431_7_plen_74_part_00
MVPARYQQYSCPTLPTPCARGAPAQAPRLLASSESRGSIGGEGRAHVELHLWGVGGHILAVASRPPRGGLGRL